jgi:mitochondrial fission protein ELM1
MQSDIWVLTDSRTGTAVQAIALAEKLEMSFEIKRLEYNIYAFLPSFLLGATDLHIKKSISHALRNATHSPKIIISAGRRAAMVALSLKVRYPGSKVIQIMRPFLPAHKFDLIVIPQHDQYESTNNTIRVIGALHNIKNKINHARGSIKSHYPQLQNFISLMVGGDTKKHKFLLEHAELLAKQVTTISDNHGLNVFISFSRRTSKEVKDIFISAFPWPHVIYDPTSSQEVNPYYGMLADGDFIITTSDSVSMCSEATASGKPLYIFCPEMKETTKHRYFVQQLLDLEIARLLTDQTEALENYKYSSFDEAQKVADFIRNNILS